MGLKKVVPTLNADLKNKEDETNVTNIMQEVLRHDEDFRTSISKMLRIGRPILQENQDKPVDSLGGAATVENDRNEPRKNTTCENNFYRC